MSIPLYFSTLLATLSKSFCFVAGLAKLHGGQKHMLLFKSPVPTLILGICVYYIGELVDLA